MRNSKLVTRELLAVEICHSDQREETVTKTLQVLSRYFTCVQYDRGFSPLARISESVCCVAKD